MTAPDPIRVLQIGDIGGVGERLSAALEAAGLAGVVRIDPPMWFAGANKPWKQAALPLRAVTLAWRVWRAAKRHRPQVVHLHWARFAPFLPTSLPVVIHAHGSDLRGRHARRRGRLVERALRRSAAVLVATPDLLREIPVPATYLPNPVDTALFAPGPPDHPPRLGTGTRVLIFARFTAIKGARELAEVARGLRSRGFRHVEGFAGGDLDDVARGAGVELRPPATTPQEVAAILRRSDVILGQQSIGSLGLAELEAMASGLPVVVRVDRTLYEHPLPVLDSPDVTAAIEACQELADDVERRAALGRAGREYVARYHASEVVGAELAAVYRRAVGVP